LTVVVSVGVEDDDSADDVPGAGAEDAPDDPGAGDEEPDEVDFELLQAVVSKIADNRTLKSANILFTLEPDPSILGHGKQPMDS
jgi:hypothetical protein